MKEVTLGILLFIIVVTGYIIYTHETNAKRFITECETNTNNHYTLLLALRDKNIDLCTQLPLKLQKRCNAIIERNKDLCEPEDFDCIAIASNDPTLCIEETCRGLASNDPLQCKTLSSGKEQCEQYVNLNADYFKKEKCKEISKTAVPWI